jgi:hypothetical protein
MMGPAGATNMAFKLPVHLSATPDAGLYWLSVPYRYDPVDVGLPSVVDAEDFCQDLSSTAIEAVLRWDEPTATFVEHLCGGTTPFPLAPGTGYAIRTLPNYSVSDYLTGGHDDDFIYSILPSGGSQLSWLSVPYHLQIPAKGSALRFTAEDLCRQIGASEVAAIVRWNEEIGAYEAYGCGSELQAPFEIPRGRSVGVINRTGETIDWQPIHF